MVFLQAPAHIGAKTKNTDRIFKDVAKQAGLTDMRNDKEGGSVMDHMRKTPPGGQSRWMDAGKTVNPSMFGLSGKQDNLSGISSQLGKPAPNLIARDPGGYSK
jgi:hypothetical protein